MDDTGRTYTSRSSEDLFRAIETQRGHVFYFSPKGLALLRHAKARVLRHIPDDEANFKAFCALFTDALAEANHAANDTPPNERE